MTRTSVCNQYILLHGKCLNKIQREFVYVELRKSEFTHFTDYYYKYNDDIISIRIINGITTTKIRKRKTHILLFCKVETKTLRV